MKIKKKFQQKKLNNKISENSELQKELKYQTKIKQI